MDTVETAEDMRVSTLVDVAADSDEDGSHDEYNTRIASDSDEDAVQWVYQPREGDALVGIRGFMSPADQFYGLLKNDRMITVKVRPSPTFGSRAPSTANRVNLPARLLCRVSKRCADDLTLQRYFDPEHTGTHEIVVFMENSSWSADALAVFTSWLHFNHIPAAADEGEAEILSKIFFTAWEFGNVLQAPAFQNAVMRALLSLLDRMELSADMDTDVLVPELLREDTPLAKLWAFNLWFQMMEDPETSELAISEYFGRTKKLRRVNRTLKRYYSANGCQRYMKGSGRCFQEHMAKFLVYEPQPILEALQPSMRLCLEVTQKGGVLETADGEERFP